MKNKTLLYHDKPLFGLDIGYGSVKFMQLIKGRNKYQVHGYGSGEFDPKYIKNGVIMEHEAFAAQVKKTFKDNLIGKIDTKRVALSIPSSKTYTRTLTLPPIKDSELAEAVRAEAEQYIPAPLETLYLDYQVIEKTDKVVEVLVVAAPKNVVDSYMLVTRLLGLEAVAFDTSITAGGRLFERQNLYTEIPSILIDFGSLSADITIHDKTTIVTGTLPSGGDTFSELIAEELKVSPNEAHIIKTKYGLSKSKKQAQIIKALEPSMTKLLKEIRRMLRYYEDRTDDSKKSIDQIVTMGGGANMPGLSEYLTSRLRLPVRTSDPLYNVSLGKLQPPSQLEKSLYVTVTGLALIEPKELFT